MPKIVDKKQMQQEIIDAAISTFLQYGVNNTTMEMIAKSAKIAKGTLYLYFASKQELISEINIQHYTSLKAFLVSETLFTTCEGLLSHMRNNLSMDKKDAAFIKIFFEAFGAQLSSESFTEQYNAFFEDVALFYMENFELLKQKGEIRHSVNTKTMSRAVVSMMDGLILHHGFFNIPDEKYHGMVDDAMAMFEKALQE